MFGQIAAANALSDVYAMGGKPITAMNLVCFPIKDMGIDILREILHGGADKLKEAEVNLVGGHSVEDSELKYGLSVTGIVHPDKIVTNRGAEPGDKLILTKPIGTGIVNTAVKAGLADDKTVAEATASMAALNAAASELMLEAGVNACTDATGFGLLGHACEMVLKSAVGFRIDHSKVPLFPNVVKLAEMGLIPAGTYRNRDFRKPMVEFSRGLPEWLEVVLFDPQTSGGLLIAVSPEKSESLIEKMHNAGIDNAAIIGEAIDNPKAKIFVV
jgi:selenide,water dikinase